MLWAFFFIYLFCACVMTTMFAVYLRKERYLDPRVLACAVFMTLMPILNTYLVIDWVRDFSSVKKRKRT